jgi:predicted  nucleic acid-binding Zn-ribbon protein
MERRTAEAGISDAQEKLRRYQRQINEVTTQREYGALLQEIDTVKSQISSFEEQGLAAMERVEASTQALEERRAAFQDLEERYQTELERWEQEKPELAREAEILRERVAGLRQDVPRPQLAQFERILERTNGQALAPIRRMDRGRGPSMWHCGACNYNVRPQVLVEIKDRGSLIQCDSCKRILYVQEERAVEEVEA